MRKLGRFLLLAMSTLWVVIALGCGPASNGGSAGGKTGGAAGSAGAGGDAGSGGTSTGGQAGGDTCGIFGCTGGGGGTGGNNQGAIDISPQNPTVTIVNGAIMNIAFTATLNGQDITQSVQWIFDRPEIGDIGMNSSFVPSGQVGGQGKLTAQYQMAQGSTNVTVFIKKTVNSGNVPQPTINLLDNPNGGNDASMSIAYPYPQTIFPLGVLSPEIQWFGGNPGDAFKIHITEKYFDYTEYFTQSPPGRHIVPQPDWDAIESSGAGAQSDPLTVAINRSSNGQAFQPQLNTWHIAQGKLKGSIYYWELPDQCGNQNAGRILRIKPGAEQVDQFFTAGGQCYGCHTVSRDGKTMMAALSAGSPFPQITVDLSANPVNYGSLPYPGTPLGGTFSAFNDKSDKILVSDDGDWNGGGQTRLRIVDAKSGATLNDNAMGFMAGEPAWSADGKKIAAITNLSSSSWIFDATGGNLSVADVGPDGISVSNIKQIVPQAGGQGRPAYPSFSPGDGKFIAFGRPTAGSRTTGNGDLWLVEVENPANLKKLAIASSDNKSFNPVFSPLRAGGYYWLVFVTRRDYGNRLIGAQRQQLWITAIDDPPSAADPSHPPFYVRGQEDCAKSENAYYALDPCKDQGKDCSSGADCCGGQCVKDASGKYVCGMPPPPGMCSQNGNSCKTSADCCDKTATCVDGFCQPQIPN
jgi:hypothetical protein